MKLSIQTDFTKLPRAGSLLRAEAIARTDNQPAPFGVTVLAHDERHLRRKVIETANGDKVLVDLAEPAMLSSRDRLVLDDGRHIEVIAAEEELYDIRARDRLHLAQLCWHIGNRHLAAQIEEDRILILRDHVIKAMLEGLGATVTEVDEPFSPVRGAYSGPAHGHHHPHAHDHGDRDPHGRLPGDPHYGHDHS